MKTKMKRLFGILVGLVMMLGLIPGMSLAAYAEGQQHTHNGITCEEWTDALAQAQNGNGKTAANSLPSVAGAYYLTKNVELDDLWSVPADTTYLCLNGHTITRNNDSYVIQIASGRTLNLANCAFCHALELNTTFVMDDRRILTG